MAASRCPACGSKPGGTVGGHLCPACLLGLGLSGAGDAAGGTDLEESARPIMLAVLDGGAERTVYVGERPGTGQLLAVEVLHQAAAAEEAREALRSRVECLRRLDHPGLARVDGAWATAEGEWCVASEYVAGTPLVRYCAARALAPRDRLTLFLEACRGLAHAHAAGIAHGRVDASSVVVARREGRPWPVVTGFAVGGPFEGAEDRDLSALGKILERLLAGEEGAEAEAARRAANGIRSGEVRSVAQLATALQQALGAFSA